MAELDDAYANAAHIPGSADYPPRWERAAAGLREGLLEQGLADLDLSYGDTARQRFDLFHPGGAPQGLLIFVHGGYWLRFDKSVWSHLAAGALSRGWAVAMPSYDLCPQVRIADITAQIAQAVTTAASMVAGPIVLAGHSDARTGAAAGSRGRAVAPRDADLSGLGSAAIAAHQHEHGFPTG